jgi:hypothetical protein
MASEYKKPDLKAPRFRPKRLNFTNIDFYKQFLKENPKHSHITLDEFKSVIELFNEKIWKTVIEHRDGVELPEQLGYIFIGSCPRKKSNVDFKKSADFGKKIQNRNWESDDYLAKIFYTNYETKYRFRNHDLWGFNGLRDFKRSLAKEYPKSYKKYLVVDNMVRVSKIFRTHKYKDYKIAETKDLLKDYDEFNLD